MTDLPDDDALLAELGDAVHAGAEVPDRFVAAGRSAFTWRTVDAELARLVADSTAEPATAGLRTPDGASRWLTFTAGGLTLDLEVRGDTLHGQVAPPSPGSARVETGEEPSDAGAPVPVDEVGYFVARSVRSGPVRVHVRTDAGAAVVTDWFTI